MGQDGTTAVAEEPATAARPPPTPKATHVRHKMIGFRPELLDAIGTVNRSAAERRAATLGTRRSWKNDAQAAALLAAVRCIDLTTLAGDDATIELLFHWAARCDKFEGTTQQVPQRMLVVGLKEPIGVLGIRAPDEYPLLGLVGTIAPAIAAGNTVVVVAGRQCLSAMVLVPILQHSDVPAGVVNVLTAEDPDAIGTLFAAHLDVDAVWSFGSREGAAAIERESARNMKRTWTHGGHRVNWADPATRTSRAFLRQATQVKNVWVPYGA